MRLVVVIFNGFDFEIFFGSNICIVGFFGGGKLIVVFMLFCFYNLMLGIIIINGVDILIMNVKLFRWCIGMVV